jgi:hypothetical protein
MLVVALFVGAAAPAFADETPPTTEPAATTPATTDPATTDPATTVPPDTTVPGDDSPPVTQPAPDPATDPAPSAPATLDVPAAAVNPVITVTPSTDLVHLQSVTVSGTGFTANTPVGFAECANNFSGDPDDCDTTHTGIATTDGAGAFSAPFVVRRILHTPNGDVDCADPAAVCHIGAAKLSDYDERAGALLTFDPDAPLPPPPTLLAGPLTDLRDGDSVALFGGGFVPNGPVAIVQCSQPTQSTCQAIQYAQTDAQGKFIATAPVRRVLATPPFGATDCAEAPDTCQLRVVSLSDYDREAHVFLSFDPDGPLPSGHLTVTPHTDLVNFQSVTVAGSGFPAGTGVQVTQCRTDATAYDDCIASSQFAPTSAAGTFSLPITVRRVLHLESGDFDCASAPGACSLAAASYSTLPIVVTAPLDFDASQPIPPAPTISVSPDTDLVQGQSVTVTGANFAPSSFVALSQCTSDVPEYQPFCSLGGAGVQTDSTGAFTQTFSVRRGVIDYTTPFPPSVVDCAESSGRCSVYAFSYEGNERAAHVIDFDASVPVTVPDTDVSPQFDLADRALVHVHSSGFAPGERVLVSQCIAGAPTYGSECANSAGPLTVLQADADGAVDTSLRVHRELSPSGGVVIIAAEGPVNCSDAVGSCVLRVQSVDDPLVVSDTDLGFDPTAVAPGPTLSITPAGPHTDGQQVTVHGAGYTPNATLGLAQCKHDVPNPGGSACDSGPDGLFTGFQADADGTFTRTVTLHTQVETTDGTLDCSAAGSCVLFAANRNDYGAEQAAVPLEFGTGSGTGPGVEVAGISQTRALAFTGAGAATMPTTLAGVALLVVGGVLLLLAKRRTTR